MVNAASAPSDVNETLSNGKPTIIDFTATWCGPCRNVAPVFAKLAEANPNINFITVDVDKLHTVAAEYDVQAMPTFITFDNAGKKLATIVGANIAKIQDAITEFNKSADPDAENAPTTAA